MIKISFIIPSRNNLQYLQQAVNSILKNYDTQHDIILLDDASTDGTWDWIQSLEGSHFIKYRNDGPERVGHTVLYDKGVELSRTEIFTIFHADMITSKYHIPNALKHLKPKTVVSATRIEPPLHPGGREKIIMDFGVDVKSMNILGFDLYCEELQKEFSNKTTQGIFAPWMMYKSDFIEIGGHDLLFAPMELEDSDIFNRMHLAGFELIQSRDSFVYHMTCRGSRYKDGLEIEHVIDLPDGTKWYKPKDSEEYLALRRVKFREWWRKWHCNVLHDDLLMPIVPNRYNIGFRVLNCNYDFLKLLEPWCDNVLIDDEMQVLTSHYIDSEQKTTHFDLDKRVLSTPFHNLDNDIIVQIDRNTFSELDFNYIQQLSQIIQESGEIGEFELGNLKMTIKNLNKMDMIRPFYKNVFNI